MFLIVIRADAVLYPAHAAPQEVRKHPSPLGEAHYILSSVCNGKRYPLPYILPDDLHAGLLQMDKGTYPAHKISAYPNPPVVLNVLFVIPISLPFGLNG